MNIIKTEIEGVLFLTPKLFEDDRGYFFESFSLREFEQAVPGAAFVQENEAKSTFGVLRGLHLQRAPHAQSKLVRAVKGRILDVAVDVRAGSPTFGRHVARELSDENKCQLFIPKGFAHGYAVLSDEAIVQYKCDAYYAPSHEMGIRFDDPDLGIDWLLQANQIILSEKDKKHPFLRAIKSDL
ncbi:MAG: dTDP-4-dehydrorhamnose 3,5-epimerase [Odoribacteraceae bacterium]|jgi:dTDP-4-dehydrorhamnose 3,5-epimerase|nr:dTDP-4-dehydrorhamnose 3,5-epimerase [Odoribacteraceae bacterium]